MRYEFDEVLHELPDKIAIHINDTHPALAVAELMRILVDEENAVFVNRTIHVIRNDDAVVVLEGTEQFHTRVPGRGRYVDFDGNGLRVGRDKLPGLITSRVSQRNVFPFGAVVDRPKISL